jgi:hypothetical protein
LFCRRDICLEQLLQLSEGRLVRIAS